MSEITRYIYVSGPLTTGGRYLQAIGDACDVATELALLGYAVYLPHSLAIWEMQAYINKGIDNYELWINRDFDWIMKCDGLLRLPGESGGADREVKFAIRNEIPVFTSVASLHNYFTDRAMSEETENH